MKKIFILPLIGLILGAVAIATEIKTTDPIPAGQQLSGAVVACIKTALETRETALLTATTTYQTATITALTTRKAGLLAAWNLSTKSEAKKAVAATLKTYKTTMNTLKNTFHTSRKTAWNTYKEQVKTCKGTSLVQNVDASSSSIDQLQ